MTALAESRLPLPLLRRGKVREVYEVDPEHLLLVASDRVSAFDVIMREPVPHKGAVLTQLSAFWFAALARVFPSHFVTADTGGILARVPALAAHEREIAGRAMLVRRTTPIPFECVVRGYLSGSAWAEYRDSGTLAGEPLPAGLVESSRLEPPVFSPATKAEAGHDVNVPFAAVAASLGADLAARVRDASFALYAAGRAEHLIAFEEGIHHNKTLYGSIMTLVLLLSSFLVAWSVHSLRDDRARVAAWLVSATAALGVLFLCLKLYEYQAHVHEGMVPGGGTHFFEKYPHDGLALFVNLYWITTGLHFLHVTFGILLMLFFAQRLFRGKLRARGSHRLEMAALYWHLVDAIWIFLWPMFYLMGRVGG